MSSEAFGKEHDLPFASVRLKYLILSQPRTGSTMISSALMHSGVAGVPMEYFNVRHLKLLPQPLTMQVLKDYYADLLCRRTSPNGVFGMKIHFDQFSPIFMENGAVKKAGIQFLKSFDRTILVSRTDKVAQAISQMNADRNRKWNSENKGDEGRQNVVVTREDVPVILDYLGAAVRDHLAWERIIATLNLNPLTVTYEQLSGSQDIEFRKLAEHLELPVSDIAPKTVRMSRDGHSAAKTAFLKAIGVDAS